MKLKLLHKHISLPDRLMLLPSGDLCYHVPLLRSTDGLSDLIKLG